MRAKIEDFGNSSGVRLPKELFEASGIRGEVEVKVESGRLVLMQPLEGVFESGPEEDWSDWDALSGDALEADWVWPEDFRWPEHEIVSTYISPDSIRSEAPKSQRPDPAPSSPQLK